jgi:phospholipid/cholesterol/gamma-HCH transport system substrate-binding protein
MTMKRNFVETAMGAAVLCAALGFALFFQRSVGINTTDGYEITAQFSKIDGLDAGSPVRISGVKVGRVTAFELNHDNYQAIVRMQIDNNVKIPADTAAVVASAGLLDGKFLSLEPGGDDVMLEPGGSIEYTQSTPGLEQLLGQVIFSLTKDDKKDGGEAATPVTP